MPYSSNKELPDSVKGVIPGEKGKSIFRNAFNSGFAQTDGDEERTFRIAWGALRNAGYRKNPEGKWEKVGKMDKVNISAEIISKNEDQQIIYGWASVIEVDGEQVVDSQNDIIKIDELTKAAHAFVSDARLAKTMHAGEGIGEIVESIVFAPDVQKSLGIDLGKVGWFIGMKVNDSDVWKRVKSGELAAFSIGGRGFREEV